MFTAENFTKWVKTKWDGCEESCTQQLIVELCHGLLSSTMLEVYRMHSLKKRKAAVLDGGVAAVMDGAPDMAAAAAFAIVPHAGPAAEPDHNEGAPAPPADCKFDNEQL